MLCCARQSQLLKLERYLFGAWLGWLVRARGGEDVARAEFLRALGEVEKALGLRGSSAFFLGSERPSMVDCVYAPFLERMAGSLLYYKGEELRLVLGGGARLV